MVPRGPDQAAAESSGAWPPTAGAIDQSATGSANPARTTDPAASIPTLSAKIARDLLVDQEPAQFGMGGDPCREVDGPPIDVAVALDHPASGDPAHGPRAGRRHRSRRAAGATALTAVRGSSKRRRTPSPSSLTTRPPFARAHSSARTARRTAAVAAASSPSRSVSDVYPVRSTKATAVGNDGRAGRRPAPTSADSAATMIRWLSVRSRWRSCSQTRRSRTGPRR